MSQMMDYLRRLLEVRGLPALVASLELERRWGLFKALANPLVLGLVMWPMAARRGDVLLWLLPGLVLVWYAIRLHGLSTGFVSRGRRILLLYVVEATGFTATLIYVAASFHAVRPELLLLYVWPLDAFVGRKIARLPLALLGFISLVLALNVVAHSFSVDATLDTLAVAVWMTLLLLALRYVRVQSRLFGREEVIVESRSRAGATYAGTVESLAHVALEQTRADMVVLYPTNELRADTPPLMLCRRGVVLRGTEHPVMPVSAEAPVNKLLREYASPGWRSRRRNGERTFVCRHEVSRSDPLFGGRLNAFGEASFASRQGIRTAVALILSPIGERSDKVQAVLFLNYRRSMGFSPNQLQRLDQLAQVLGHELAAAKVRIERSALEEHRSGQMGLALHDYVAQDLNMALWDLQALRDPPSGAASDIDMISRAMGHAQSANSAIHMLIAGDNPSAADLLAELETFVKVGDGTRHEKPRVRFEGWDQALRVQGNPGRVWAVYWIIREALSGAFERADVSDLCVRAIGDERHFVHSLVVSCAGPAYDLGTARHRMREMTARASANGAKLTFGQASGRTEVKLDLSEAGG